MMQTPSLNLMAFFLFCISSLFATNAMSEEVSVRLTNGKRVVADRMVGEPSNSYLILEIQRPGITVVRKISWKLVQSIDFDEQKFSPEGLRAITIHSNSDEQDALRNQIKLAGYMTSSSPSLTATQAQMTLRKNTSIESTVELAKFSHSSKDKWKKYEPSSNHSPPSPPYHINNFPNLSQQSGCQTGDDCDSNCLINYFWQGIPTESVIVGVRADPLSTYSAEIDRFYPHGIPINEAPYALDLLRSAKAYQVLEAPLAPATDKKAIPPAPKPQGKRLERIQTISVNAEPISAHGRVDWDSLSINVQGYSRNGNPIPARGTLRMTLWGRKQELVRSVGREYFSDPKQIVKLATWTSQLADRQNSLFPLPNQMAEHNPHLYPVGELHVELLVPGQGTFEAIQRDIVLKHISSLRNQLQTETGSSFFSKEGTYGRRRPSGLDFRETSSFRPESAIFTVKP